MVGYGAFNTVLTYGLDKKEQTKIENLFFKKETKNPFKGCNVRIPATSG